MVNVESMHKESDSMATVKIGTIDGKIFRGIITENQDGGYKAAVTIFDVVPIVRFKLVEDREQAVAYIDEFFDTLDEGSKT